MVFSIIIPTCNRNQLLAKCLDCLIPSAQTIGEEYEVIVSDDGKNNDAKELIEANYPWVKWVEGPKQGPAANRNNGARLAKGEWVVFLDDDCLPDSGLLVAYAHLIKNDDAMVFEGCVTNELHPGIPLYYAPSNEDGGNLWSCNFCIQKNLFERLKGFDEVFRYPHMEDMDLKKRIENAGVRIAFAKTAMVVHPWRKLKNGKTLGAFQEMYVYYAVKHGLRFSRFSLLKSIFFLHLQMICRHKLSIHSAKAVVIGVQHLTVVFTNFNKWKRTYVV